MYVEKVCADEFHVNRLVSKAVLSRFVTVKTKSVGHDAVAVEVTEESRKFCTFFVASIT